MSGGFPPGNARPANHRLDVAYVGTRFHGWQVQPGKLTVQGLLEHALAALYRGPVDLLGSGRTDAGVHARRQTANYFAPPLVPAERLAFALNTLIPPDIRVLSARRVPAHFHARKSALGKEYRYTLLTAPLCSPFRAGFVWPLRRDLDVDAMQEGASRLLGRHDFTSFCAHAAGESDRTRTVRALRVTRTKTEIRLVIQADGFLHHMVRNIVGTLVEVGTGKRPPAEIAAVLAARDRCAAGATAPAQGLELVRVFYGRLPRAAAPGNGTEATL